MGKRRRRKTKHQKKQNYNEILKRENNMKLEKQHLAKKNMKKQQSKQKLIKQKLILNQNQNQNQNQNRRKQLDDDESVEEGIVKRKSRSSPQSNRTLPAAAAKPPHPSFHLLVYQSSFDKLKNRITDECCCSIFRFSDTTLLFFKSQFFLNLY